jgi:hypothetical protein
VATRAGQWRCYATAAAEAGRGVVSPATMFYYYFLGVLIRFKKSTSNLSRVVLGSQ